MNYSTMGFTFQKMICEKYNIENINDVAKQYFESSFDPEYNIKYSDIIDKIFATLGCKPISCETFSKDTLNDGKYNFILDNGKTLSIRTSKKSMKVAPRVVGQPGIRRTNQFFGEIYGKEIKNKEDVKNLFINHIAEIMPIMCSYLLDADYIIWIYLEKDEVKYEIVDGNSVVDLEFNKKDFKFSRKFKEWNVSNVIYYRGVPIADIEVFNGKRNYIFRFHMLTIIMYIKRKEKNNETLGISAEKAICDLFKLNFPSSFINRSDKRIEKKLYPVLVDVFKLIPPAIRHCGNDTGSRGGLSKSSYDFVLKNNLTLSLKTNEGNFVCPPEVGQPSASTCYLYFKDFID